MAVPELTLLGKFVNTNPVDGAGKAVNTTWSPPAVQTTSPQLRQGMINTTEVGEVLFCTVEPAEDSTGVAFDLPYVQLVLDGVPYDPIVLDGGKARNMAPRPNRLRRGNPITFGLPMLNPQGSPNPWFQATCPKFTESVVPQVMVGGTAVLADYTVYVWGYVYDATWLAGVMPVVGGSGLSVPDHANNRKFEISEYAVAAKNGSWRSAWKSLPGGPTQGFSAGAQVYKLVRRARNSNPTTPSQAYTFQYQNSSTSPAVARARDNLYWNLTENQAILLERFGVRGPQPTSAGADLLAAWVETPSESQQRHPQGGVDVSYLNNQLRFGLAAGRADTYDPVPPLTQGTQLLWNERAYPTVVDNGTSLPANSITMAIVARVIETGSGNAI